MERIVGADVNPIVSARRPTTDALLGAATLAPAGLGGSRVDTHITDY
jgi:hypothetical protein